MSTVVTLAGEGEYDSAVTMRPIAEEIAQSLEMDLDYRIPNVVEDAPLFPESSFGGLDVLVDADLLVLYTRYRALPDDEMAALAAYADRGGPIVALRTSTHAFHSAPGSRWEHWTSDFAPRYLGSPWSTHHGHRSRTLVEVVSDNVITAEVTPAFEVDSWLYVNSPPPEASVLLTGKPIDPEVPPQPSPVAWSWNDAGRRVFYTSLGTRRDLERRDVRRLLVAGARWCIATEQSP